MDSIDALVKMSVKSDKSAVELVREVRHERVNRLYNLSEENAKK